MNLTWNEFIKMIIVGFITVLLGYVAGFIVGIFNKIKLPEVCKSWNRNYVMEQTLFLTGMLIYVITQFLNKAFI